ncbi:MAG TPA: serine protein kinase RIO [Thermoplasmata archaeon]|jgi:RIO kinase 1|nr:serine protein kinase RIO [Thermoplasmata archaeon]
MRFDDKKLALLEERVQILRRSEKDDDTRKTYDQVFDQTTLLALYKLISDGTIATVDYPVSTGKEGNVFHATTSKGGAALKIYRVNTATFRSLSEYLEGDPRFKKIGRTFREMISVWAQKEYKNLRRMHDAGVHVPDPIAVHQNCLLMDYLGDDTMPAPVIREVRLEDPRAAYEDLVASMAAMRKAELVHGDLSEYNVLWWDRRPWVIDCAQAVHFEHPRSDDWFRRDVANVVRYFSHLGVDTDAKRLEARLRGR